MIQHYPLGAQYVHEGQTHFTVWAPLAEKVALHLIRQAQYIPMQKDEHGYFSCEVANIQPDDRYMYQINGEKERPDPASRYQPDGVHGASAVVDGTFAWDDMGWQPPSLRNTVIYEIHVGTFTPEGTFDAIIPHLHRLKTLGITTIELMPIAQFPGGRNWGYDGVQIYAVQNTYGGLAGLKRLVNACHQQGLAVLLDVVYNHLGPEGNYLWDYAPYFTQTYQTPWGASLNFDGAESDHVRRYFIQNALYWLDDCHIDGLRLDATHALFDFSAIPFLTELVANVHDWADRNNRQIQLIAENDRSDRKLLLPHEANGVGIDAQWLDDLHHVLHHTLTGETQGYYADYANFDLMYKVLREGFAYSGQYSPFHRRKHGTSSVDIPKDRFVVCTQNHDQVGNRMLGERLTALTDFDGLKLATALVLLSPYVPLLFMGEEYGETAPFLYFISHGDAQLLEAVRKGRAEEFAYFKDKGVPPDPSIETTFQKSKLNHDLRNEGQHAILYKLYAYLLNLRHSHPALTNPHPHSLFVYGDANDYTVCMERHDDTETMRIFLNFHHDQSHSISVPAQGTWQKVCDSNAPQWSLETNIKPLSPDILTQETASTFSIPKKSFVIYQKITRK